MVRDRYTPHDNHTLIEEYPWSLRIATAADAATYDVIEGNLYWFHETGGVRDEIEAAD
jgi:hypothetical protein